MKSLQFFTRRMAMPMVSLLILGTVSCQYDDTELKNSIDDLTGRVEALEDFRDQVQSDIQSLQTIVEKMQEAVTVTDVEDNGDGYTISFSDGTSVSIKDGRDGQDGEDGKDGEDGMTPPTIIVMEEDGIYYWGYEYPDGTEDFIRDNDGNRIPVGGGMAPQVRINPQTGNWEISTDGGLTWEDTGMPSAGGSGESIFKSVELSEDGKYVHIILSDDSVFTFEMYTPFEIIFETTDIAMQTGKTEEIPFTLEGADEMTVVETIVEGNITAEVTVDSDFGGGTISVTASDEEGQAKIIVFVNDGGDRTLMRTLNIAISESTAPVTLEITYVGADDIRFNVTMDKNLCDMYMVAAGTPLVIDLIWWEEELMWNSRWTEDRSFSCVEDELTYIEPGETYKIAVAPFKKEGYDYVPMEDQVVTMEITAPME